MRLTETPPGDFVSNLGKPTVEAKRERWRVGRSLRGSIRIGEGEIKMTIGPTVSKSKKAVKAKKAKADPAKKAEKAREEMLEAESRVKKLEASVKTAKIDLDKYTAALYRAELSVKNSKPEGV